MRTICVTVMISVGLILASSAVLAAAPDTRPASSQGATAPSPERIAQWIRELDDDKFAVRQRAEKALVEAGEPAVAALAEAARGDSAEVTMRSISALEALAGSEEAPASKAATAALEKLAAGETKHPSAAKAKAALERIDGGDEGAEDGLTVATNVRIVAGAVQVGLGGGRRVTVRNTNGKKEVDATEDGRRVQITEDKDGAIKMKVTGPAEKGKKPAVKAYEADSAKELKKKHPEAHKLYEKYADGNVGGMVVNIGNVRAGRAGALQKRLQALKAARQDRQGGAAARMLDKADERLDGAVKKLRAAREKGLSAEETAKLLREVEAARKYLGAARRRAGE